MGALSWADWFGCLLGLSSSVCPLEVSQQAVKAPNQQQYDRISTKPTEKILNKMRALAHDQADVNQCFQQNRLFQYCMVFTTQGWRVWDENMQEPYQIYVMDSGPDFESNGLYRIRQNGKIGYAVAKTGLVQIKGQYDCAWPFANGVAYVGVHCQYKTDGEGHGYWVSGQWQKINRQGEILEHKTKNPFGE